MTKKASWLKDISDRRKFFYQKNLDRPGFPNSDEMMNEEPRVPDEAPEEKANLISSWLGDDRHAPAIDLDIPHTYRESKTPGHGHLLLDVDLSFEQYKKLLDVLLECGIIQQGFHHQIGSLGATFLRIPKQRVVEAGKGKKGITAKRDFDTFKELYLKNYGSKDMWSTLAYSDFKGLDQNVSPEPSTVEPSEAELLEIEEENGTMCMCGDPDCDIPVD